MHRSWYSLDNLGDVNSGAILVKMLDMTNGAGFLPCWVD